MIDPSFPLDYFKKRAKKLYAGVRAGDLDVFKLIRKIYVKASSQSNEELAANFTLMQAQHVVAKEHGFNNWTELIKARNIDARRAIMLLKHPEFVNVHSKLDVHSVQGDRVLLEWKDPDERVHRLVVEKEKILKKFKPVLFELLNGGFRWSRNESKKLLKEYILHQSNTGDSRHCIERTGWFGNSFILPDEIISIENDENFFFDKTMSNHPNVEHKGSLTQWKQSVARLASGNSRFVFSISAALAGPLVRFSKASGTFHFFGSSSNGKTSALEIAASVWGEPRGYRVCWWYAEKAALEFCANVHNDFVFLLDTIEMMAPAGVRKVALMLANGPAKKK